MSSNSMSDLNTVPSYILDNKSRCIALHSFVFCCIVFWNNYENEVIQLY